MKFIEVNWKHNKKKHKNIKRNANKNLKFWCMNVLYQNEWKIINILIDVVNIKYF
jgi:hypothetical protein